jgi:hypothetical protein
MLRYINLGVLAVTISCATHAEDKAKEIGHLLTKNQLQCLYTQVESLLAEPVDPAIILLSEESCKPSNSSLKLSGGGEKTDLPELKLPVNPAAEKPLKPEEVLVLNKAQLTCFKQQFATLMKQEKQAIQVTFPDKCATQEAK